MTDLPFAIVDRMARSLETLWSPSGEEFHTFNFQYPLRGAFWTFCSFSSRFRAVVTASGRFRSCSAKSRSLTITSPVGYRWWVVCPYDEILSASDRNSFFCFRSDRLARIASVPKARRHIAAIPRAETINAIHQRSGTEE
jgi:hypothetical protein